MNGFVWSFNPLNQVYVFNFLKLGKIILTALPGFNPLNQVYVFNDSYNFNKNIASKTFGFNPLNQVYVFNRKVEVIIYNENVQF